jgi:hypothetical protein
MPRDLMLPTVKSMILCDDLLLDEQSDKIHLMGVFNTIHPEGDPAFPYRLRKLSVFLQLTDAEGEYEAKIVICKGDTDRVISASPVHMIDFLDRLQLKWAHFRLLNCPFPHPGLYWVQFHCEGQVLSEQRLGLLR